MDRVFYKCPVCLSVVACDGLSKFPICSLCDKPMLYMGRVEKTRLVRDEKRVPCDARCTNASGPSCECQCRGENHGSGRLVTVTYDAGGIPKVSPPDSDARTRRDEYQAAKAETNRRIEDLFGKDAIAKFKAREWIDGPEYWDMRRVQDEYHAAAGLKTHKGRLRALAKIAAPRLSR